MSDCKKCSEHIVRVRTEIGRRTLLELKLNEATERVSQLEKLNSVYVNALERIEARAGSGNPRAAENDMHTIALEALKVANVGPLQSRQAEDTTHQERKLDDETPAWRREIHENFERSSNEERPAIVSPTAQDRCACGNTWRFEEEQKAGVCAVCVSKTTQEDDESRAYDAHLRLKNDRLPPGERHEFQCGCELKNRAWNPHTGRCETCSCAYVASNEGNKDG